MNIVHLIAVKNSFYILESGRTIQKHLTLVLFWNWTNPSLTFLQITSCKKVYYMKTMIEKSSVRGKFQQFSSIIFGRVNMTGYDIKASQPWFLFAVSPI